jgi:hypothetical protein
MLLPQAAAKAVTMTQSASAVATVTAPTGITFNPKIAHCKTSSNGTEDCVQIQWLPLKDLTTQQRAERKTMMAEAVRAKQSSAKSLPQATSAAATRTAPSGCAFTNNASLTYVANPTRLLSCLDGLWTAQDWRIVNGAPVPEGTFEWEDQSWITYSDTSTQWVHDMNTYAYPGFGTLANGLSGTLYSNCYVNSASCIAVSTGIPDPQQATLTPGSSYSYEWDEQDAGPATTTPGDADTLNSVLGETWDVIVNSLPQIDTETGLVGRCDNNEQTDNGDPGDDATTPPTNPGPGCVNQANIPTLYLSLAKFGASASLVQWAQIFESAHWGLQGAGQPLTRLANPKTQMANRNKICQDGSFTPDPTITADLSPYNDKDTCDEFPFAATYQSGAQNGVTTGAQCAQLTSDQTGTSGTNEAADWLFVADDPTVPAPTLTESCVRGHVPGKLNSPLGGEVGRFVQKNRLIDRDGYWVSVTS